MTTTGNVTFSNVTQAPVGERTIGDNSRFAPVSQADIEALLTPQGFVKITVPGVNELVYAKLVHGFSLRIYTGCNADGVARPRGQDAIRTQLWGRGGEDNVPFRARGAKRTMRVPTWRKNLLRKIADLTAWAKNPPTKKPTEKVGEKPAPAAPVAVATPKTGNPPCPICGGGTTAPKANRNGNYFHGCLKFPKCRGAVNAS